MRISKSYACIIKHITERPYAAQTNCCSFNSISIKVNNVVMQCANVHSFCYPSTCNFCIGLRGNIALRNCSCRAYIKVRTAITLAVHLLIDSTFCFNFNVIFIIRLITTNNYINIFIGICFCQISTTSVHAQSKALCMRILSNHAFTFDVEIFSIIGVIANMNVNISTTISRCPVYHKITKACTNRSNACLVVDISFCTKIYSITSKSIVITNY